jgi:hypothetical protein
LTDLYSYVGNDPINRNDPNGMFFNLWTAVAGALIGGLFNGALAWASGQDFWLGFGAGAIAGFVGGFTLNPFLIGAVSGGLLTLLNRQLKCPTDSDPLIDYAIGIGGGALTGGLAGKFVDGARASSFAGAIGGLFINVVWSFRQFWKEVAQ